MICKVADAQWDIADMVSGLHRVTVSSNNFICHGFDGVLVVICKRVKELFDRSAPRLQECVRNAVCRAAKETCVSLANEVVANDMRPGGVVDRVCGTNELIKTKASLSQTTSRDAQVGSARNRPISNHRSRKETPQSVKPNMRGARDCFDHSGYGA